jgi:RimJ/RimL family protein N-acetyltransferase
MADWEPYATMWADPRVTAFIGGVPRPRDVAWMKFGQAAGMWTLFGYGNWSAVDRATGDWRGIVGFAVYARGIAELQDFPEAGWAFTADSWGRGIATEALSTIHHWADGAGIAETRCLIDDANGASVAVAQRIGYAPIATRDDKRVFRRRAASVPDRG